MNGELQFLEKLKGILELGNAKNRVLSVQDVEEYFEEEQLSEEQMKLVYDYLLAQKIAVSGYEKQEGKILSFEKKLEQLLENKMEEHLKYYSPKVVEIALDFNSEEYLIEDLIQEGNVGLMMSLEPNVLSEQQILANIRQAMQMLVEDQEETKVHDRKMIEKVAYLDECVTNLKEELERKPTLEELAVYMGLTEDEVNDILRLTGEEDDDEEDEEESEE